MSASVSGTPWNSKQLRLLYCSKASISSESALLLLSRAFLSNISFSPMARQSSSIPHDYLTIHAVASRRTRGPIDKISFGAPFWPVTNHSCSDTSLFEPGFEVDPTGPGQTTLVSPRARGRCHCGSARCPPNTRLTMASVMIMFTIQSNHFLQKVASVAIACYWTRSMRSPAFHRPNGMFASRCDWIFSCDLIFSPKFFGLPDTPLTHSFCIADGSPNNNQL